ncbi:Receptor-interacting serine/threonine-protein kinase 1 [Apostichopus japonicus]|uniref:Receptor-interacting serine/threonine-protein kinase 1 n=1 Tax=Stichopus japonicus TaxID=307972 RepID=A0A2G8LKR7_STIJA|nr:Receptor-interacting serine/threonine-protein kinase 1 [Apostichopus japonicus]
MDGGADSAASSSNKVVDAGLSQSQKKTGDESQTVKQPLENIELEVRTESLRHIYLQNVSASSLSGNPVPSQSAYVQHSKKRRFNESTAVVMDVSSSSLRQSCVTQSADVPHQKKRRYNESTAAVMAGVEDSAASSSKKVFNAGLSQSQKKTGDESLTVKQPLENIELEIRTESLRDLSGKILKKWKKVGRNLGLKDPELCILERDNNNQGHKETVYQMLLTWKHSNGSKATYRVLGEALIAAGRRDLQEMLYKQDAYMIS